MGFVGMLLVMVVCFLFVIDVGCCDGVVVVGG